AIAAGVGFTDVDGHWAVAEILAMQGVDIATGNPDGSFKPDGNLNRAEAAALLYRVLGFDEPTAPTANPFPDVPMSAWYAGYVSNMKALEMIHGYGDGTYGPGNNITRAEFMKIALEVYYYVIDDEEIRGQIDDWMVGAKTISYSDLADDWYTPYVTTATNAGFVGGFGCGTSVCFGATNDITRAEATVILYNMFYDILTADEAEEMVDEAAAEDEAVVYDCTSDLYNCADYTTEAEAQAVYDYCMTEVATDVHALDADENGLACEELE
ncbi:MAG: S-layer homology domain-containing protein, partial [Patescibacteria group bacterium]